MKKGISLFFIVGSMSIISCGPNAEEKEQLEAEATAQMDSLFEAASQSMMEASDSSVTEEVVTPVQEVPATEGHGTEEAH